MSPDIKEIVNKVGIDSVIKTREELEKSVLVLQDFIVGAKAMNDVLARSGTMGQLTKNVQAQEIAQEKLKQSILKTQALELKLESERQAAFAKEQARQSKLLADEQKALALDEKRIAALQRKSNAQFKADPRANDNTSPTAAADRDEAARLANEATALSGNTQQRQRNTAAKKLNNLEQEKANQLAKIDRLNLVAQAKEGIAVKGSLEQRQLALARLQKTYSLLTAEERLSPFGQRLGKTIPQLNQQVLGLEASLGKAQRNVGNYGNAFTKAFSGIRQLAYILPGVGIAGLFNIAFEAIGKFADGLDLFATKTTRAQAAQENLNKTFEQGAYSDAVKNVNELRINIDLAKNGFIAKSDVVKQYNETIGQTTGQVKTLNEAETALNKNADAYIQFTLLKAAAQLSLGNAAQEAVKAAQQAQEDQERLTKQQTAYVINGDKEGEAVRKILTKDLKRENEQRAKDAQEAQKKQLKIAEDFQKKAAELAKKYNFTGLIDTKKDPKAKDNSKAIEKDARDSAAARIQIEIDAQKQIADVYKSQFENQNFSQQTRLSALQNFTEAQFEIARLEQDKEVAAKKLNEGEKLKVDADFHKKAEEANKNASDATLKILKDTADEAERIRILQNEKAVTLIGKHRDEELTMLINAYQKRGDYSEKAQEELEQKRLEIMNKYALQEVNLLIEQAQKQIDIRRDTGADVAKEEADLSALILKAKDLELKGIDEKNKERLEKEKQNAEKLKELAQEVFDFSRGLTNSIFEANISNLEEESKSKEEQKNRDIENINESTLSEKEKADRIAVINAQAEQNQKAIDARIAEQKRKQAIADKAFALTQIAINTAVAVSKALAQTGVLGAFVIPGIIALGAIQAAAVLAQPIPKFAKGGVMAKDGLAEYGHGVETRIDPDGRVSLTDSTPEIGFVKKGTRFISASETKQMLAKPDKFDIGGKSWDVSGLIASQDRTAKRIEKSVNKLKVPTTMVTKNGWHEQQQKVSRLNSYVKSNFGRY